jgi:glutaconate CoA-transferase, subunit A
LARFMSLGAAVEEHLRDGASVAMEGFTHLIPYAAGHEVIRQGRRDLTIIRMTPDILYDQLIGMGLVRKMVFSWGGNPGVGSLHRMRDAVENGFPLKLELEEHSHAAMANAYEAGASNLPFAVFRGYKGVDLPKVNPSIRSVTCPYTGEVLATVPAIRPDVAIIHALKADRQGNILLEGIVGVQKEAVLAAKASSPSRTSWMILARAMPTPSSCRTGPSAPSCMCRAAPFRPMPMAFTSEPTRSTSRGMRSRANGRASRPG